MTSRATQWRLAILLLAGGSAFSAIGLLLFPDSNLGDGLPLLGAPIAACGVAMLLALATATGVVWMNRGRRHDAEGP